MARVETTRKQITEGLKPTKKPPKRKSIQPYKLRINMSSDKVKELIDKVLFEKREIEKEKSKATSGLQESDAVSYRIEQGTKIYLNKVDYTDFPFVDASNIPGIIIPTAIDGLRSNIIRAITTNPPATGVNVKDTEKAIAKEKYIQYELRHGIPKSRSTIAAWLHSALLHGTGVVRHYIKTVPVTKTVKVEYKDVEAFVRKHREEDYPDLVEKIRNGEIVKLVEKENKTEKKHILEWIDTKDLLIREKVFDANEANFIGHKVSYTAEEILDEAFDNIDELLKNIKDEDYITNEEEYDTIHAEIKFDWQGNGKKEKILVVVAEDEELLLFAERVDNDFSMYILMFVQPFIGSTWREGFYDKLRSVHQTQKEIIDIILNSAYITFIPSFKAKKGGSFDPQEHDWYPGVVWWLRNMDDVVQWDIRPSQMPFEQWADKMRDYAYEKSGVSPYTSGSPVHAGESGRKIENLLAAGGVRIAEVLLYINEAFNELYFQILEFAGQKKEEIDIHIDKEDYKLPTEYFTDEDENRRYTSALDEASITPDAILQRNMLVIETLSPTPMLQQNPQALRELYVQFLRSARMGWEQRVEEVLPTIEELRGQQVQIQKEAILQLQKEEQQRQIEEAKEGLTPEEVTDAEEDARRQLEGGVPIL